MQPARPLSRKFYLDPPEQVARKLLGKLIARRYEGEDLIGRIVEAEAYCGLDDAAAHAAAGKTTRNAVIFGPPGFAYVYFIYGMHHCLNFSCEPEGQAGCVLIRALEPVAGLETMAWLRGLSKGANPRLLTSGPGRLCQALGIVRDTHNGLDITDKKSGLYVTEDNFRPGKILTTPRIGIRKAVEHPLRFAIEGNDFVSRS